MRETLKRPLGAITALALVGASLALTATTAGTANAASGKITDYGFQSTGYGSRATSAIVGLRSDRTARSIVACTRKTGKKDRRTLVAAATPTNNPYLGLGAVDSNSTSFKSKGRVGSQTKNKIASVRLGASPGLNLTIAALESTTTAWATKNGKLHSKATYNSGDIALNSGVPLLDNLFAGSDDNLDTLLGLVRAQPDGLVIPGIGRIREGGRVTTVQPRFASAKAIALRVTLFGADLIESPSDDTQVTIGFSKARINRDLTVGVFSGYGYGVDTKLLSGAAGVGSRLAEQRLKCQGTAGKVLSADTVGANLGNLNLIGAGAAGAKVFGKQEANSAKAWTSGRIASFTLGSGSERIVLKGVVGKAMIKRLASGGTKTSTAGSDIVSLRIGGDKVRIPKPGSSIKVGDLARLEFFVTSTKKSSVKVTAVRVVLLDNSAGVSTVDLGVAKAAIRKH